MHGRRALACVLVATNVATTAAAARLRGAADDRERRRLNARTRAAHAHTAHIGHRHAHRTTVQT